MAKLKQFHKEESTKVAQPLIRLRGQLLKAQDGFGLLFASYDVTPSFKKRDFVFTESSL